MTAHGRGDDGTTTLSGIQHENGGIRAFLYDADDRDREVDLDDRVVAGLNEHDLLWVDLDSGTDGELGAVAATFGLPRDVLAVPERSGGRPDVKEFPSWLVVSLVTLHREDQRWDFDPLTCVVGRNWLITAHPGPLTWLDTFDDHVKGDSALGNLDATSFLSQLCVWMIDVYFQTIESLQAEIDAIEDAILRDEAEDVLLQRLVSLRRRIGVLRSRLSPHRRVFATLGHPAAGVHEAVESPDAFTLVNERFELAMQALETTREMVVGAFDLHMTQTSQHTNDIVKLLTTMSVLLLPAALVSSILGMDMVPAWLQRPWAFWASLAVMAIVSVGLLYVMRRRRWM